MAKVNNNRQISVLIFFAMISVLMIVIGINGINDIYRYVQPIQEDAWQKFGPYTFIIFGGMILGVALNKAAQTFKDKNGKS